MSEYDDMEAQEALEMAEDEMRAEQERLAKLLEGAQARVDAAMLLLRGRRVPGATKAEQELIREVLAILEARP